MEIPYLDNFRCPSVEEYTGLEQEIENSDLLELTSINLGMKELRRLYDDEERRRNSVEAKATGLVAVNGTIISIIKLVPAENMNRLVLSLVVFFLVVSAVVGVWNLLPKKYLKPLDAKTYLSHARKGKIEFESQLFVKYTSSVMFNQAVNDVRYRRLILSAVLTVLAILGLGASILVNII
jgi:hypothetical protein